MSAECPLPYYFLRYLKLTNFLVTGLADRLVQSSRSVPDYGIFPMIRTMSPKLITKAKIIFSMFFFSIIINQHCTESHLEFQADIYYLVCLVLIFVGNSYTLNNWYAIQKIDIPYLYIFNLKAVIRTTAVLERANPNY